MSNEQKILAFAIATIFSLSFFLTQSVYANNTFIFNKNLQIGTINTDVKELQKFLNNNGFILNKSGVGSSGQETTFFGSATKKALIKFQKANKINPALGYFGPVTRNVINKITEPLPTISTPPENIIINSPPAGQTHLPPTQNIIINNFTISGNVTGLASAVILQNNGQDDLIIDAGQNSNFTFSTALANNTNYNVTAKPKYSDQICYTNNNSGVINNANVTNVKIACGANLSHNPFTYIPSGSIATYSLSYTAGAGGTISGASTQTVNSDTNGSAVTAVPNTGYSFTTWSDGVLTAERTDRAIRADKSVSATFTINTFTVAYDANENSGGTKPDNQTKTYGATLVLADNSGSLIKTGYTFSGWNTSADGTGTDYAVGADYITNADITLYAKWTINSYTITFDINGGDAGTTATQTLNYATSANLNTNGFTRPGYTFDGWAVTATGTVAYANGASYTIGASNVILYAKWSPSLAVGNAYQGGIIGYILQSGDPGYSAGQTKGLIVATTTTSNGIVWAKPANQASAVPGGTSALLGQGSSNTDKIITQNGLDSTYAAGIARSHTGGGYSDWYLPSLNELIKLYPNRATIGGFTANYYWSSTEVDADSVWSKHFTGQSESDQLKNTPWTYVRAVRSF